MMKKLPAIVNGIVVGLFCLIILACISVLILNMIHLRLAWHLNNMATISIFLFLFMISILLGVSIALKNVVLKKISIFLIIIYVACMLGLFVYTLVRVFILHNYY